MGDFGGGGKMGRIHKGGEGEGRPDQMEDAIAQREEVQRPSDGEGDQDPRASWDIVHPPIVVEDNGLILPETVPAWTERNVKLRHGQEDVIVEPRYGIGVFEGSDREGPGIRNPP